MKSVILVALLLFCGTTLAKYDEGLPEASQGIWSGMLDEYRYVETKALHEDWLSVEFWTKLDETISQHDDYDGGFEVIFYVLGDIFETHVVLFKNLKVCEGPALLAEFRENCDNFRCVTVNLPYVLYENFDVFVRLVGEYREMMEQTQRMLDNDEDPFEVDYIAGKMLGKFLHAFTLQPIDWETVSV